MSESPGSSGISRLDAESEGDLWRAWSVLLSELSLPARRLAGIQLREALASKCSFNFYFMSDHSSLPDHFCQLEGSCLRTPVSVLFFVKKHIGLWYPSRLGFWHVSVREVGRKEALRDAPKDLITARKDRVLRRLLSRSCPGLALPDGYLFHHQEENGWHLVSSRKPEWGSSKLWLCCDGLCVEVPPSSSTVGKALKHLGLSPNARCTERSVRKLLLRAV